MRSRLWSVGLAAILLTIAACNGSEQLARLGAGTNLTFSKGSGVYSIDAVIGPNAAADAIEAADKALALDALNHIG